MLRYIYYHSQNKVLLFRHNTIHLLIFYPYQRINRLYKLLLRFQFRLYIIFHYINHLHTFHLQNIFLHLHPLQIQYAFYHFGKNTMQFHHHTTSLQVLNLHHKIYHLHRLFLMTLFRLYKVCHYKFHYHTFHLQNIFLHLHL